jgi:hypothetical protein
MKRIVQLCVFVGRERGSWVCEGWLVREMSFDGWMLVSQRFWILYCDGVSHEYGDLR